MTPYINFNRGFAVTKSDTVDLPQGRSNALYVGGAGVVAAVFEDGSIADFTAAAGQILPLRVKRVNSTNTTATLIVALYQV